MLLKARSLGICGSFTGYQSDRGRKSCYSVTVDRHPCLDLNVKKDVAWQFIFYIIFVFKVKKKKRKRKKVVDNHFMVCLQLWKALPSHAEMHSCNKTPLIRFFNIYEKTTSKISQVL